jgi:hypothetical protein
MYIKAEHISFKNTKYYIIFTCVQREVVEIYIRGPFAKFVYWPQCAAVMQREAVTVTPSCSGGVT